MIDRKASEKLLRSSENMSKDNGQSHKGKDCSTG